MIGVIADDLTGAAEIGGIGWRHGLRTDIIAPAGPPSEADLVCVDTDSRTLAPEQAAARVRLAARTLQQMGARWIYKKVDSVLRGHVLLETQVMLQELGLRSALVVPANPGRGRVVRGGEYLIHGQPIHETEFARDPEYPRSSARVRDLLGDLADDTVKVGHVSDVGRLSGIVLGEAASGADLQAWAASRSSSILLGGASEFFEALLAADWGGRASSIESRDGALEVAGGPALFVCGSRSESAAEFVQTAQRHGVPVFAWPEQVLADGKAEEAMAALLSRRAAEALRLHSAMVVTSVFAQSPASSPGAEISRRLARFAFTVTQQATVAHLFAEGGATAACLVREMGCDHLSVVGQWASGVVSLEPVNCRGPRLTIKPGSYTWPQAVQDRLMRCEPSPEPARGAGEDIR